MSQRYSPGSQNYLDPTAISIPLAPGKDGLPIGLQLLVEDAAIENLLPNNWAMRRRALFRSIFESVFLYLEEWLRGVTFAGIGLGKLP